MLKHFSCRGVHDIRSLAVPYLHNLFQGHYLLRLTYHMR